ncbi:uncharacterized protein CLAFUR5_02433 [Fulvia fulva]|uniref:Uncharacterized protein n=1 Tax=Passalora fulva TaxID=5499 RepID=A0A9Q8L9M9_PASFU|nr:uncharacterized protein CLAFUR5_02433 [Fulvia fulva]UJO13491.1 hypothetical protein CLAFUR5_02433 [Fulvia fulva]
MSANDTYNMQSPAPQPPLMNNTRVDALFDDTTLYDGNEHNEAIAIIGRAPRSTIVGNLPIIDTPVALFSTMSPPIPPSNAITTHGGRYTTSRRVRVPTPPNATSGNTSTDHTGLHIPINNFTPHAAAPVMDPRSSARTSMQPNSHLDSMTDTLAQLLSIRGGSDVTHEQQATAQGAVQRSSVFQSLDHFSPPSLFSSDTVTGEEHHLSGTSTIEAHNSMNIDPALLATHCNSGTQGTHGLSPSSMNPFQYHHSSGPESHYMQTQRNSSGDAIITVGVRGLQGNFQQVFGVQATAQSLAVLQSVINTDGLMTPEAGTLDVLGALTNTLHDLQHRIVLPDLDWLPDSPGDVLNSDFLAAIGVPQDDVRWILATLPASSGQPEFKGDRSELNHPNFAFTICKLLSALYREDGVGLQLLITTDFATQFGNMEVYAASDNPTVTLCLHREVVYDMNGTYSEQWRPYHTRPSQLAEQPRMHSQHQHSMLPSEQSMVNSTQRQATSNLPAPDGSQDVSGIPMRQNLDVQPGTTSQTIPPTPASNQSGVQNTVTVTTTKPQSLLHDSAVPTQAPAVASASSSTAAASASSFWAIPIPPPLPPARSLVAAPTAVPSRPSARARSVPVDRPLAPPPLQGRSGYWGWLSKGNRWRWQSTPLNHHGATNVRNVEARILYAHIQLGYGNNECGELFDQPGNSFYNARLKKALRARAKALGKNFDPVSKEHQEKRRAERLRRLRRSGSPPAGIRPLAIYELSGEYLDNTELAAESAKYTPVEEAEAAAAFLGLMLVPGPPSSNTPTLTPGTATHPSKIVQGHGHSTNLQTGLHTYTMPIINGGRNAISPAPTKSQVNNNADGKRKRADTDNGSTTLAPPLRRSAHLRMMESVEDNDDEDQEQKGDQEEE